jgi:predicted ATPase/DNA-binding CsgD family transcriptional regulator
MAKTPPIVKDGLLTYPQGGSSAQVEVDSADWYTWLETASSFAFRSGHGSFTARKERAGNRRGSLYWRAYCTREGKVHRVYLGKSEELTFERLLTVATALAGQGNDGDALDAGTAAVLSFNASFPEATPTSEQAAELPPPFPRGAFSRTRAALPTYLTSLLGREQEVQAISALLERHEVRLLTLTGPGGVGKTRLAVQVASHLQSTFADGVCFVSLASISDPDLVFSTLAQALGLLEPEHTPLLEHLKSSLHGKHLLLLLDNFEQVVNAAPLVGELLLACPAVKALVTSRTGLRLHGEYEFPVTPLALPGLQERPDAHAIARSAAVALFVQRASAIKPGFSLSDANAAIIAAICTRLDGLPLAIELAAARVKLLPAEALLAQLQHRLAVLTGGPRDLPARQQALRSTLQWSYDLLTPDEQRLFRRFAVFAGGCQLAAAEAICTVAGDVTMSVLDGLASLLDNSLLSQVEHAGEEPRFVMLETIREYGLACLDASGETARFTAAHVGYYLALAEAAEPHLLSAEQGRWLKRLEQDHENLRAALGWSLERKDRLFALRLAAALWRFWLMRGYLSEGRKWLEQALAVPPVEMDSPTARAVRAKALGGAGILAYYQGEYQRASKYCQESLAAFRALGDRQGIATALSGLALIARSKHAFDEARLLYEESLAILREQDDRWQLAETLFSLARLCVFQQDYRAAQAFCEESLTLFRTLGDQRNVALTLQFQGGLALLGGDYATAQQLVQEGLPTLRALGDRSGIGRAFFMQAELALAQGNAAQAQPLYTEALAHLHEVGDKIWIPEVLQRLATAVASQGHVVWAARLLGAATALFKTLGTSPYPILRATYDYTVATSRATVGEDQFAAAWQEGQAMTLEAVLTAPAPAPLLSQHPADERHAPSPARAPAARTPADDLTAREVEVLRLLAQGLTNAQMAERLVISPRTIHAHVRAIYSKLGLPSRVAATHYAIEHHVLSSSLPDHA